MRISDWSSDVCSSDLGKLQCGPRNAVDDGQRVLAAIEVSHPQHAWIAVQAGTGAGPFAIARREPAAGLGDGEHLHVLREHAGVDEPSRLLGGGERDAGHCRVPALPRPASPPRSEEHTSELPPLMRIPYSVFHVT